MGGFIILLLIQHENCTFFGVELHCHLWPVWLYHIFPHYLINDTIFFGGGGITEHKMYLFIFSTTFV